VRLVLVVNRRSGRGGAEGAVARLREVATVAEVLPIEALREPRDADRRARTRPVDGEVCETEPARFAVRPPAVEVVVPR
jgi:diacylglycerol kinase family enzyme